MRRNDPRACDLRLDDVTVHVTARQETAEAGSDGIEFITGGAYYRKNGTHFIRYMEQGEGMENVTTTVKVEGEDRVTVIRHGAARYQIVLAKGERRHAFYDTGCGELQLGVSGTRIRHDLGADGGSLHVEYLLDINNAVASRNTLDIRVTRPQN